MFPIALLLLGAALASEGTSQTPQTIWLTHARNEPSHLVVHWETATPTSSLVRFGPTAALGQQAHLPAETQLHKVEIPFDHSAPHLFYAIGSGHSSSPTNRVKTYSQPQLRVAVVADWQSRPELTALLQDDVHLLVTAGDNIADLHSACGPGVTDCWKPYSRLIAAYPDLFSAIPIMPVLGNHDREIRPRGPKPPPDPVYDIDAAAFRTFFSLPDEGWKWRFDLPEFQLRFIALDLNHTSDQGTTWQTCHPFDRTSEQFQWYRDLLEQNDQRFVITLHNEQNARMRRALNGEWGALFQRGSAVITGFGYYAERAEVDGFPYFNTALGIGDKYPDPESKFFESTATYLLLEFDRSNQSATISIKALTGKLLDRTNLNPSPPS